MLCQRRSDQMDLQQQTPPPPPQTLSYIQNVSTSPRQVCYSLFFLTWPLSYPKTDDNNIEQGQNPGAKLRKTDCRCRNKILKFFSKEEFPSLTI